MSRCSARFTCIVFAMEARLASPVQVGFREQLRAWLDEHADAAPARTVLAPLDDLAVARQREWQRRLADAGYVGITWPVEYGGGGGEPAERVAGEHELQ